MEREKAPRRRRPDARPGEILDAAFIEFAAKGFSGTTLVDIARRAGVSHGTVYNYYRDKEDVFRALVRSRLATPLAPPPGALQAIGTTSRARLRFGLLFAFRSLVGSEGLALARLLIVEADRFPDLARACWTEIFGTAQAMLRAEIDVGIAAGEFIDGPWRDDPLPLLAPGIVAALFGPAAGGADWVAEREKSLVAFLDAFFDGVAR